MAYGRDQSEALSYISEVQWIGGWLAWVGITVRDIGLAPPNQAHCSCVGLKPEVGYYSLLYCGSSAWRYSACCRRQPGAASDLSSSYPFNAYQNRRTRSMWRLCLPLKAAGVYASPSQLPIPCPFPSPVLETATPVTCIRLCHSPIHAVSQGGARTLIGANFAKLYKSAVKIYMNAECRVIITFPSLSAADKCNQ